MSDGGKEDLDQDIKSLYQEKDMLGEQIRRLDQEKIERLEKTNAELEKKAEWMDRERIKITKERDNYRKQVKNFRGRKWSNAFKLISALVFVDLVIVPLLVNLLGLPVQWIFISLGVITFFGILLIASYMSGSSPLDTGEVRKAITGAFVVVYFALVPIAAFGGLNLVATESIRTLITNFTWIVGIVVILYFGSRAVEEVVKSRRSN